MRVIQPIGPNKWEYTDTVDTNECDKRKGSILQRGTEQRVAAWTIYAVARKQATTVAV